ncbi:MAG: hypothetical protein K0R10_2306 [Alphaproteobacteria bacterium]|jgi:hypothetical protein|nr:hypothetical protein [Alphaproteobacteria bacterium]
MGYGYMRELALQDASVATALKDLANRIIPAGRFDDFREAVDAGAIDPLDVPEKFPMMSAVSQVLALPEAKDQIKWLKELFDGEREKFRAAVAPNFGWQWGSPNTNIAAYDDYRGYEIERTPLFSLLAQRADVTLADFFALDPQALAQNVVNRDASQAPQPLLHHIAFNRELTVKALDDIEAATGNADFLLIKNARGETLFHRIASYNGNHEDETKIDILSWMSQRKPNLVNEPDRFGWTPLDRLLSHSRGKLDTTLGRFLLASNAKLAKQIAPEFNLKAQLQENEGLGLDKQPARKLATPTP